ncbi:type VI secretion system accessory protein TagJ [Xanthobacteraceae bacterium A53D]
MTAAQTIARHLASDDLAGALEQATAAVRSAPADVRLRCLLADLLVLKGDFERADKIAAAGATLVPADATGWSLLRGEIRGMHARAMMWSEGAVPEFAGGPSPADQAALALGIALRTGEEAEIATRRAALEAALPAARLSWNGAAPAEVRDLDDRLPHALEVITSGGACLWIGFSNIARIEMEPVRRPRDFAFRTASLTLTDGSAAQVLLPLLYPTEDEASDSLRLGRETQWVDGPGGVVTGRGQKCLLVGDEVVALGEAQTIAGEAEKVPAHV